MSKPDSISSLVRKRATYKMKITLAKKKFNNDSDQSIKDDTFQIIKNSYHSIVKLDSEISDIYCEMDGDDISNDHMVELDSQT